jgi:hypothetical protein
MKKLFILVASFLTVSCSNSLWQHYQTIKWTHQTANDAFLSNELIASSNYDFLYVKRGEQPVIVMVLGFKDGDTYKWLDADKSILTMQDGRIIRSYTRTKLDNDLIYVTNAPSFALPELLIDSPIETWTRQIDVENKLTGQELKSTFKMGNKELVEFQDITLETEVIVEHVTPLIDGAAEQDNSWENKYWFDSKTKQLVKTQQQVFFDMPSWRTTFASRIVRISQEQ